MKFKFIVIVLFFTCAPGILFFPYGANVDLEGDLLSQAPTEIEPVNPTSEMLQPVRPSFPDKDFYITNYSAVEDGKTKNTGVLQFTDVQNSTIKRPTCPPGMKSFVKVNGKQTDHIQLVDNFTSGIKNVVSFGTEVRKNAVRILPESGRPDNSKRSNMMQQNHHPEIFPFGEGGQIKMLYDRRQRPQSVFLNNKVYIVFNAGAKSGARPKASTKPMIITFDPNTRKFSKAVTLGPGSRDHHYGPVIWSDNNDYLHLLFGCHKTPGTHLISRLPAHIGSSLNDWRAGPQIAPSISYPAFHRIFDGKELIYYRTAGHISSWTYRISADDGLTWQGPENDVTDMDSKGRFEWSSYHCTLPSKDGKFLHVAFIAYDDNRQDDPGRYYNPRYGRAVSNEWKYNLYDIKIDLQTRRVTNFEGEVLKTPIDINQANAKCRIWDTEWRGAGVPPTIVPDENGNPAFLHVLSGETIRSHSYYYVHRAKGRWEYTPVAPANHQWNSCHISRDAQGILHAYLVTGNGYLDSGGYMDSYGGGEIEEWISRDKGENWQKARDLTPDRRLYPGWRFNNIQPVVRPDGSAVQGMLLFYGWQDKNAPEAKGFLLFE